MYGGGGPRGVQHYPRCAYPSSFRMHVRWFAKAKPQPMRQVKPMWNLKLREKHQEQQKVDMRQTDSSVAAPERRVPSVVRGHREASEVKEQAGVQRALVASATRPALKEVGSRPASSQPSRCAGWSSICEPFTAWLCLSTRSDSRGRQTSLTCACHVVYCFCLLCFLLVGRLCVSTGRSHTTVSWGS